MLKTCFCKKYFLKWYVQTRARNEETTESDLCSNPERYSGTHTLHEQIHLSVPVISALAELAAVLSQNDVTDFHLLGSPLFNYILSNIYWLKPSYAHHLTLFWHQFLKSDAIILFHKGNSWGLISFPKKNHTASNFPSWIPYHTLPHQSSAFAHTLQCTQTQVLLWLLCG